MSAVEIYILLTNVNNFIPSHVIVCYNSLIIGLNIFYSSRDMIKDRAGRKVL